MNTICKEGVVVQLKEPDIVMVEIVASSACSGCHAKSICIPQEQKKQVVTAVNRDKTCFEIGETVNLSMEESMGIKAVLIGYFFPFLVLVITLFITYNISHHDLISVGSALLATTLYYLIIKLLDKKIEKKFQFYVLKKEKQ